MLSSGSYSPEILRGFWDNILFQLHDNTPQRGGVPIAAQSNVEKDKRVALLVQKIATCTAARSPPHRQAEISKNHLSQTAA
jgi:hypothetical protein